jgi:hypothetical protein
MRRARAVCPLVVLALLAGFGAPVRHAEAADDPSARWRSLQADRLLVLYDAPSRELAEDVLRAAARALQLIEEVLGWELERDLTFVLTDNYDSANGSASVLPYPVVRLHAHPPHLDSALAGPGSWTWRLVLHELVHIIHLQRTGGVHGLVNDILGPQYFPNQSLPGWFIEGLAVYLESMEAPEGRLHHPVFLGRARITLLEGIPLPLDRLGTVPIDPPGANAWYIFGSLFLDDLARERGGPRMLAAFADEYGRRLIPYGMNTALKEVAGTDFPTAYAEHLARERTKAEEIAKERGGERGEGKRLVGPVRDIRALELVPHRRGLLTVEGDGHEEARLLIRDPQDGAVMHSRLCIGDCSGGASATEDGALAILARSTPAGPARHHRDLYAVSLAPGEEDEPPARWTFRARLSAPDAHRYPSLPVLAVRSAGGRTSIVAVDGPDAPPRTLISAPLGVRLDMPRFAWSGSRFVYVEQGISGSRLVMRDLEGGAARVLLEAVFPLAHPAFTTDDRAVAVAAPSRGVYDVAVVDLESGDVSVVTSALGGVRHVAPLPDGEMAFTAMRGLGWSLQRRTSARVTDYQAAFAPSPDASREAATTRAETSAESTASAQSAGAAAPAPPPGSSPAASVATAVERDPPYLSLMRPRAIVPRFAFSTAAASSFGLGVSGGDPLGHHGWGLDVSVRTGADGSEASADAALRYGFGAAPFDFSTVLVDANQPRSDFDGVVTRAVPARLRYVSLAVARRVPAIRQSDRVSMAVDLVHRGGIEELGRLDPAGRVPSRAHPSLRPAFRVDLGHSGAYGFPYGTVAERGFTLGLAVRYEPAIDTRGSERVRLEWRTNLPAPLPVFGLRHLVLTNRLRGRLSLAHPDARERFRLGGIGPSDPIRDLIDRRLFGYDSLRGFPPSVFAGEHLQAWTADLSLPAFDVLRGIGTLPFALRRLVGALFVDAGWIGPYRLASSDLHAGAGGELRTELDFGFTFRPVLRAGVARGFGPYGETQAYLLVGHHP